MRSREETQEIYFRNIDTVYRVCMLFFHGRKADAEDAVQTAFVKLMKSDTRFKSAEQEKAWLIVTASNICRDILRSSWRKRVELNEEKLATAEADMVTDEIIQLVMALPDKCKTAVYMYYYEGFTCGEIAKSMGKTQTSVWGYLHRGRKLLHKALSEEA